MTEQEEARMYAVWDKLDGITTYDPSRYPTKSFFWLMAYKEYLNG